MKKNYNIKNLNVLVKIYLMINFLMKDIEQKFSNKYPKLYESAYVHLMFIKHVDGISQRELGYLTNTNKSTLFRNLNVLEKYELIKRKISVRGNENELYLTPNGEKMIINIDEWILEHEHNLQITANEKIEIDNKVLKILDKFLVS